MTHQFEAYKNSKAKPAEESLLGGFFLNKKDSKQGEELQFITSVANSFTQKSRDFKNKLAALKNDTPRVELSCLHTASIINGAYLMMMRKIEETCKQAGISKDPHSNQLYGILEQRVGQQSEEEKIESLKELNEYLHTDSGKKIDFGSQTPEKMWEKIDSYIQELSAHIGVELTV